MHAKLHTYTHTYMVVALGWGTLSDYICGMSRTGFQYPNVSHGAYRISASFRRCFFGTVHAFLQEPFRPASAYRSHRPLRSVAHGDLLVPLHALPSYNAGLSLSWTRPSGTASRWSCISCQRQILRPFTYL